MREHVYYVYMLTNRSHRVLYTGVTNDLFRRVYEHQHGLTEEFTQKYKVNKLVYFEQTSEVTSAILREKQIKGWLRSKKEALIVSSNPTWEDLSLTFGLSCHPERSEGSPFLQLDSSLRSE